ncbi:MAG TPA: hypothetical protein VHN37_09445 [Actinomycetota bacterium]|nr:hypothetical protein [Actinomycetota bacterium]
MSTALVLASVPVPQANAAIYTAEYTRAVAYWYLPTDAESVYRMYRVEVVQVRDLQTGEVSARASVVTDRCTERWIDPQQMILVCDDGRREWRTRAAELVLAPDLASGEAQVRVGGRTHIVRFEGPERPEEGVFTIDGACSPADRKVVAGRFSNMERAHGRVLGKKLRGPYHPELDHSWVQRGHGTWCDESG